MRSMVDTIDAHFTKKLGAFRLSADMKDGGLILLTGRNGAGKSTFLLCLLGYHALDSGSIVLNGRDVTEVPVERRHIAFVSQSTYFGHMDVEKHLSWGMTDDGRASHEIGAVREKLGIDYEGRVRELSLGQRIRVAIATAVLASPEALLLDEAISNLSGQFAVLGELKILAAERKFDLVCVSQGPEWTKVADHHYAIEQGSMSRQF